MKRAAIALGATAVALLGAYVYAERRVFEDCASIGNPLLKDRIFACDLIISVGGTGRISLADAHNARGAAYSTFDQSKALADYNMAIKLDSTNEYFFDNRAQILSTHGKYDQAIADYTAAIRIAPTYVPAYRGRGEAYHAKRDYISATADFDEAIRINPSDADNYNARGNLNLSRGNYKEAIKDYGEAIKRKSQIAYVNRGTAHVQLRNYIRAIGDLTHYLDLNPGDVYALVQRGDAYKTTEQPDLAFLDFDAALKIEPEHTEALVGRGLSHVDLGDYTRAIVDFDKAITINKNNGEAYFGRGLAYAMQSSSLRAIAEYTEAIRLMPKHAQARFARAQRYTLIGEFDGALADYDAYIALKPNWALGYNKRCLTRALANKELSRAMADCDKALSLQPNNAFESRALVHYRLGNYRAAIADADQHLNTFGHGPASLVVRGLAKRRLGDIHGGDADIIAARASHEGTVTLLAEYGLK